MKVTRESYLKALDTLTDLEAAALMSFWESSSGAGHDFGWTNEVQVEGLNMQQVGGLVSSLIKKNLIAEPDTHEFKGQTEFVGYMNGDEKFSKYEAAELVASYLPYRAPKGDKVVPVTKPDRSNPKALMAWVRSFKKGSK